MTDQPPYDQDGLTSEIFADSAYGLPEAVPKEFKPWHRPRKQFVRREQWAALLKGIYENREPREPMRYLGLPGPDLLDLRYLYEQVCLENERPMLFLGFNSEARSGNTDHVQLNVSLDEVRQLPNVDRQSVVMPDDFRSIADQKSLAWVRTRNLGPFDIVNIDLCDGIASDSPDMGRSIYRALDQLMALQARNLNPWLLLVTTRIGRGMFDTDAEERLFKLFGRNVNSCAGFAEACEEFLELEVKSIDLTTYSAADLLKLLTAAVGKWLATLVQVHRPTSRVELASTHAYRVNPVSAEEDLVSLALRVEPVIAGTPDALSPTPPPPEDECATAKAILRRSARRVDVDTLLQEQGDVREKLIGETEQLLAKARYNISDYRAWLAS